MMERHGRVGECSLQPDRDQRLRSADVETGCAAFAPRESHLAAPAYAVDAADAEFEAAFDKMTSR